jgi:hypothetical protein
VRGSDKEESEKTSAAGTGQSEIMLDQKMSWIERAAMTDFRSVIERGSDTVERSETLRRINTNPTSPTLK